MARWVAGLDGCKGRWAGALLDLDDPGRYFVQVFDAAEDVFDLHEAPLIVGIDVPIGLPAFIPAGGRSADQAARTMLGTAGQSSVFIVPSRFAIYADTYEEAKALSRAQSERSFAPSIQCWSIFRYIKAVDRLLIGRPELISRVREVQPETAFRVLNKQRPLAQGKKALEGLEERRELLLAAGLPEALVRAKRPPRVGHDDLVDAMAGLVVARDALLGKALPLPDPPELDDRGIPIAIWIPAERR